MMPISPLSKATLAVIQTKIDEKTKPLGALGALEPLAVQLALISEQRRKNHADFDSRSSADKGNGHISIKMPTMLVFAGDHGINEEKLSIAPSEVTQQMLLNFLQGGAAINCFCQSNELALRVIDCGILQAINPNDIAQVDDNSAGVKLIEQRLGAGTNNFSVGPAMSISQVEQGFEQAEKLVNAQVAQGVELLLLGEMGIANTSSAAALMSALTCFSVEQCVGRGTGITDEQLAKKTTLIEHALQRVNLADSAAETLNQAEITELLSQLGGFEIVQMVAAILTAAANTIPVVIDGFIVSVAALVALRLDKNVANYLIFAHVSEEKAHQLLLSELLAAQTLTKQGGQALLNLGLRLGEGTGAALAYPLIKAAASFYNHMASFESAGVTV
ncbi:MULTISPECIES: nicotinate-nucleotide--dimethylbenzimidazole phosphoribosyltransferase [Colwellia]|uniref:Nicotinate-nucleotide--dimethylbenzimidazole phosphoribosyltransferase n=1 Tax=Colwellia marinimaniae TaxID=1513592 RepID=A0ABQ0MT20_9GAMM|nr:MULTISPECIES: nicotinate-nucleotide--dimethylbenzimidazole phosphoribosyltransferase [Colwellia]GAW95377.1 nicotinate-nucleotide--dimethylbenzimidazole phosphoribosyltransferase [Colwellia marinimaniae]